MLLARVGTFAAAGVVGLTVVLAGCGGDDSPAAAPAEADAPLVRCHPADGPAAPARRRDVSIGPLVLVGARDTTRTRRRPAFGGHGYKIPATLPVGATATLSVPARLRRRVGLVFTPGAQRRAWRRGVRGADSAVTFSACGREERGARRSGWPGGIVVDRPRCAPLIVRVPGRVEPLRRRVPLGRPCR